MVLHKEYENHVIGIARKKRTSGHLKQLKVKTRKISKQIPYKQQEGIFQESGKEEAVSLK